LRILLSRPVDALQQPQQQSQQQSQQQHPLLDDPYPVISVICDEAVHRAE